MTGNGSIAPLSIAMIGTRGVPAAYGGFETAVEEIGRRLVERGHTVTVYCRGASSPRPSEHLGMRLVHLPAIRKRSLETLSHTAASVAHVVSHERPDVAFVFNSANAPFVPILRARKIPVAVHVDGLEWRRAKWSGAGKRYYRRAEELAVRTADALIADARGIADYYAQQFNAPTEQIAYGAPIATETAAHRLQELGLEPGRYHLVVARLEPENHVDVIAAGYQRSRASMPLVIVGGAPYAADHVASIGAIAAADERIRLLGSVWDQELLDALYGNALSYLHGHSVGGTNPSLLRAMGAAAPVIAFDVIFNQEVAGADALYFTTGAHVAEHIERAELDPDASAERGRRLQRRARDRYDWDAITDDYESLAASLAAGESIRPLRLGRRSAQPWSSPSPSPSPEGVGL